jgi:hypothetical protein
MTKVYAYESADDSYPPFDGPFLPLPFSEGHKLSRKMNYFADLIYHKLQNTPSIALKTDNIMIFSTTPLTLDSGFFQADEGEMADSFKKMIQRRFVLKTQYIPYNMNEHPRDMLIWDTFNKSVRLRDEANNLTNKAERLRMEANKLRDEDEEIPATNTYHFSKKRKSPKRKSPKRKSPKRKSPKRKSPKRKH